MPLERLARFAQLLLFDLLAALGANPTSILSASRHTVCLAEGPEGQPQNPEDPKQDSPAASPGASSVFRAFCCQLCLGLLIKSFLSQ